jgi:hypothetical protein
MSMPISSVVGGIITWSYSPMTLVVPKTPVPLRNRGSKDDRTLN